MRARGTASPAAIRFVSHAFLAALEDSGSVGPGTGWTPAPILIEDDGAHMVAAAPAYLKAHSQGEYVFDHGWAEAWERAGGEYYPKLQVAVPFTPVPGLRLLGSRPQHLLAAIEGGDRSERDVVGPHHVHRRGQGRRSRAPRMAHPRGHPVSLVQSRLCELRRFPRRADQPQRKAIRKERAAGPRRAASSKCCAAERSARPNGMRCGISTRTPAAGSGATPT